MSTPTPQKVATPTPTPTKLDMLQVMQFVKPGFCLSGTYDVLLTDPTLQLHIKNPLGFPVDARFYDNNWIYDQQTEVNWQDAHFVKLHVNNGGRGNRMVKRYLTLAEFPYTIAEDDSPVLYVKDGQYDFHPETAGPTTFVWQKPFMKDWGGDVKNVLTYLVDYYWSGKRNREQYFFCPPFGLVKWNHGNLQADGSYKLDNDPPASLVLQSLASWQKTLAKTLPGMSAFTYNNPFMSPVKFPRGTY